ncbi:unnamed protein product [Chrysoparadoxa australica]
MRQLLFHLLLPLLWPCLAFEEVRKREGDAAAPLSKEAGPQLTTHLLRKFIVIPEVQLLFCSVPKVANTQFHLLLEAVQVAARREQGLDPALPPAKNLFDMNTPQYHGLELADLEEMVMDPTWKKAVFYRDPVTRFLSAYRSKCEEGHDGDRVQCKQAFGSSSASFDQAIATIQAGPVRNLHWSSQVTLCGGLSTAMLEHYDLVAELRPETAEGSIMELLQLIGLDTDALDPAISELVARPEGHHTTKAEEHICDYYSTRQKWEAVVSHYKRDYQVFDMVAVPPCSWGDGEDPDQEGS